MTNDELGSMSQQVDNRLEDSSAPEARDGALGKDFAAARGRKRELLDELRAPGPEVQPPSPEELLPRWPTDPQTDPDVASLLFEDFLHRRVRGEEPSVEEYEQRFPEHADSLAVLFR